MKQKNKLHSNLLSSLFTQQPFYEYICLLKGNKNQTFSQHLPLKIRQTEVTEGCLSDPIESCGNRFFFWTVQRDHFPSVFGEDYRNHGAICKFNFITNTCNNKGVIFQSCSFSLSRFSCGGCADTVQRRWETSKRIVCSWTLPLSGSPLRASWLRLCRDVWDSADRGQAYLIKPGEGFSSLFFLERSCERKSTATMMGQCNLTSNK